MRASLHRWRQGIADFIRPALLVLCTGACTVLPSAQERHLHAAALAQARQWQAIELAAPPFTLTGFTPLGIVPGPVLTVYLEGDGFAWAGALPSTDPTPRDPLALRLALAHPAGNAAYLARPCQYVGAKRTGCLQRYWTNARAAPEVVAAMDTALDALKQRFGARRLELVGYSGGGALAVLLAARRRDVVRIVTVAGNLDHRAWTAHHRVRPLDASLNAADVADLVKAIPQVHWIGASDRIIPPRLARDWPGSLAGADGANIRIVPGFSHSCCWAEDWPRLMGDAPRTVP